MKTFGALVYAYVPVDKCSKFDRASTIGFITVHDASARGYMLYFPESRTRRFVSDVRAVEAVLYKNRHSTADASVEGQLEGAESDDEAESTTDSEIEQATDEQDANDVDMDADDVEMSVVASMLEEDDELAAQTSYENEHASSKEVSTASSSTQPNPRHFLSSTARTRTTRATTSRTTVSARYKQASRQSRSTI